MMHLRPFVLLGLLGLAAAAFADHQPTAIRWPGWTLSSGEETWAGAIHGSYPLQYLIDGDPATAWVFSGKPSLAHAGIDTKLADRRYLALASEEPVRIDGIRLMNGYNKSEEVFFRNDRVIELEVWNTATDKRLAKAKLPDARGWHTIRFPAVRTSNIRLKFTGLAPGVERDLCISELRLTHQGQDISFQMPSAILSTSGSDCGCGTTWDVVSRRDTLIARGSGGESPDPVFSSDGRFVAGYDQTPKSLRFWLVDLAAGKSVYTQTLFEQTREKPKWYPSQLEWTSRRTVQFELYLTHPPTNAPEGGPTSQVKVIRIPDRILTG